MTTLLQLLFLGCAVLLAHVFVGYPLMVVLWARWRPKRVLRRVETPTVTVIIAVHDGTSFMPSKLDNLAALEYPSDRIDVVIACDGCTDSTATICRTFDRLRIRVLTFAERRGKAACLNDAVALAGGEFLLFTDVRQKLARSALRELVADLADVRVGASSGELLLEDATTGFAKGLDAYWRYEKMIRNAESRTGSTVGVTGALYLMRRELFEPLPHGTVLDDVLVPMRIAAAGYRVVFQSRALAWDRPSQRPEEERRRKIRTLAGNYQLIQLAPWLLDPRRNPLWFRFVSHKLLRLAAPWLLLALLATSLALAPRSSVYAATAVVLLTGVALVGFGQRTVIGRWLPVRIAVAFFHLNLSAAQAPIAFVRNRSLHLW